MKKKYFCIGRGESGVSAHPFLVGGENGIFAFEDKASAENKVKELEKNETNNEFTYSVLVFDGLPNCGKVEIIK